MRRRSRRIYAFVGLLANACDNEAPQGLGPSTRPSPLHHEPLERDQQHCCKSGLERSDRITDPQQLTCPPIIPDPLSIFSCVSSLVVLEISVSRRNKTSPAKL
jgi:hypothetical protein